MTRLIGILSNLSKLSLALVVALLLVGAGLLQYRVVDAIRVDPRSMKIDNVVAGAHNVTYELTMGVETPGTLGSIRVQFCSNTSLIDDACIAPLGFDVSNAAISSQIGEAGFTIHPSSTTNELLLGRSPVSAAAGISTYTLDAVTNPSVEGTMFMRVYTYSSDDGTGAHIDTGGLAVSFTKGVSIDVEVPPFLLFCAGATISGFNCATTDGDLIDFGQLGADRTAVGISQMLVATNAASGYGIRIVGPTLASGNNVLETMTDQPSQLGLSQFGMNLRQNILPFAGRDPEGPGVGQPTAHYNTANRYHFSSGEIIASNSGVEDYRKFTASYIVNVPKGQPGGVYATTVTYICLANF